jgi:hypothetical protein
VYKRNSVIIRDRKEERKKGGKEGRKEGGKEKKLLKTQDFGMAGDN